MLISLVEGRDLDALLTTLSDLKEIGRLNSLRISQQHDGKVMFKVNGGMWSVPMAGIDPSSDLAFRRREAEEARIRLLTEPDEFVGLGGVEEDALPTTV